MIPVLTVKLFYMSSGRVLEDKDDVFDSVFEFNDSTKDKGVGSRHGSKADRHNKTPSKQERVFSLSPSKGSHEPEPDRQTTSSKLEPEPEDSVANDAAAMSPGIATMVQAAQSLSTLKPAKEKLRRLEGPGLKIFVGEQ
jgi:hypothetical protein